jgi:superfamily II DNA or RNA helicase
VTQGNPLVPIHKRSRKKYQGAAWVDVTKQTIPFEDVNYSAMLRTLEDNHERNEQLLESIWDAAIVKGKQTLVLGLLKSHLVKLATMFAWRVKEMQKDHLTQLTAGLLFPETKEDVVDRVKSAKVIFATFQYASEAFDVGTLSALVLVSPYKSRLV